MRSLAIFRWVNLATGWTPGRPFQISTRRLPSGPTKSANGTAVAKILPVSRATVRERWTVIWFATSIVKHLFNVIFFRGGCPDIPFITSMRRHSQVKTPWRIAHVFACSLWFNVSVWYADFTWAEDRALRGRTPSADPAAGIQRARAQLKPAPPRILAAMRQIPGVWGQSPQFSSSYFRPFVALFS
jgi:hypothetical protein